MNRLLSVTAAALFAALAFSGCFGSSGDGFDFTPGKYKETGNTIHLKATVVDLLSHEVAPGMKTNLWAFCFAPFETDDQRSADAIELPAPLPGDAAILHNETFLALGWKCGVPGPTLRVTQGDRVIVEFSHSHFHPHTIHWHGQYVPYLMDGVPGATQDPVEGGGSYKYDFIAKREGTLWYHCHVDTQLHVMQGLYGMMIVEPQSKKYEPQDIDGEFVLVFSSLRRALVEAIGAPHSHPPGCASGFPEYRGVPCENPPADVTPDIFLLNGHSYPFTEDDPSTAWNLTEGNRYRIRMLNAGVTTEEVHFHGHDVLVTHFDGLPLESPYWADTVVLGPANRVDVVIDADNPGVWVYHTHVNNHETNCGKAPGGMHSSFVYEGHSHGHEFRSELPASCATPLLVLPGDFIDEAAFQLPVDAQPEDPVLGSWQFPIDLFCAVKGLRVEIALDSENGALQAFTRYLVVIVHPNGVPVATYRLGGASGGPDDQYQGNLTAEYHLERESLTDLNQGNLISAGNYTVQWSVEENDQGATNPAMGGTLDLSVVVDYHANLDDTKAPHLIYGIPGCPGFT